MNLKFDVIVANNKIGIYNFLGTPYILTGKQHAEFHKNLFQLISKKFFKLKTSRDTQNK